MKSYLKLVNHILADGEKHSTRNGDTISIFGVFCSWDLQDGFPILTTKKMKIKSIASELAWILEGSNDENRLRALNETNTTIWTKNADEYHGEFPGDVGKIYGPLLRNFNGVDQLKLIVQTLKHNPTDRRMLVTMWDPSVRDQQCLPTCHYAWQVYVRDEEYLDLMWQQRSVDVGLGLPYDIVLYAILNHLLCNTVNLKPGKLICSLGDTHIYEPHIHNLIYQTTRDPLKLPKCYINDKANVFNFKPNDISLINYQHYSSIKLDFLV